MKPAGSMMNHAMIEFLSSSSTGIAAKIFADAWGVRSPAEWWSEYEEARSARETGLATEARNLFAVISKEFGLSKARAIFKAVMTGKRGNRKMEEQQKIDRAILLHYCLKTQSPRETAKRVKELGVNGSPETVETRVKLIIKKAPPEWRENAHAIARVKRETAERATREK
jgi:hypothetical protein